MSVLKRFFIVAIVFCIITGGYYFFWLYPRYTVPILVYHAFGYREGRLVVSPENFSQQMTYLKNKGYNVISLDELVKGTKNNRRFPHNTVVITIDDGYKDNYIYAYPILKEYGFPATIFLATNLIGNKEDYMSWEEVQIMSKDNISFGGHAKNDIYLPSIKQKEVLWDEVDGCKGFIKDKINTSADYFCYPKGGFTEDIKKMVKEAGYKGACTTNRGYDKLNKDVYELKRIKVTNSDTNKPFNLWIKLSGYYNLFRNRKKGD